MRILLTNDDGIDAPGLAALERAASGLGELLVVAPTAACSGCGHQVTTHRPLVAHEHGPGRFAVDGTPADCVRVALHGLGLEVDAVLSGINAGGNLGADVYISGTVAAAREAALFGLPAVALSQYRRRDRDFDWDSAAAWAAAVLPDLLLGRPHQPGAHWNVNFPHLGPGAPSPEAVHCPLDSSPMPVLFRREGRAFLYRGDYHGRPRVAGSDVEVCFSDRIAVSLLRLG